MLKYGYGGMTVDDVIRKAGLSKGAFFYHFKSKEDLAQSLVQRYAEHDRVQFDEMLLQAEKLSSDPAEQLILLIGLYITFLEGEEKMPDGCLYASYCYESGLLDNATLKPVREMMLYWRDRISAKIREAIQSHPPRIPVDPDALADSALVFFEGAYVLIKTLKDPDIMIQQLDQYRRYLALLFGKEASLPRT